MKCSFLSKHVIMLLLAETNALTKQLSVSVFAFNSFQNWDFY